MTGHNVRLVAAVTTDLAVATILAAATTPGVELVELTFTRITELEAQEFRARIAEYEAEEFRARIAELEVDLDAQKCHAARLALDLEHARHERDEAEARCRELEPDIAERLRNPASYAVVKASAPAEVEVEPLTSPDEPGVGEPLTLDDSGYVIDPAGRVIEAERLADELVAEVTASVAVEPKVWPCPNGCGKTFNTAAGLGGHRGWCNNKRGAGQPPTDGGEAGVEKLRALRTHLDSAGEARKTDPGDAQDDEVDVPVVPRRPNVLGVPTAKDLHPAGGARRSSGLIDRLELPKDTLTRSELLNARGYDQ